MRKDAVKLTEREWAQVFTERCRSKRGERLTDDDRTLVDRAFTFDATVPFGSNARYRRS